LPRKVIIKKSPPVCRPSGTLDQSQANGAAQLDLAGRTTRDFGFDVGLRATR
jgi:hypothetical protein